MRIMILFVAALAAPALAQAPRQAEADGYTRYELLEPGSGKFRILYEVSATTPGAIAYFNPIRAGSVATDERVTDRATGKPLRWEVVSGAVAAAGGVEGAEAADQFIKVTLARPVPSEGGEARLLIDKTYQDSKSYFVEGQAIVFDRSLGVKRNSVVLPSGYELVSSNYPAQVLQERDGRLSVSFWNATPAPAPLRIVAQPARGLGAPLADQRQDERARQSREIVYYLNPPETHSFALTHDYTETKPGTRRYVNVVRAGSKVERPSARNLDTGEALRWEVVRGTDVLKVEPDAEEVSADTQAVVFHFAPVQAGQSVRIRIAETYTDPSGYRLTEDGRLHWRRTLGRPWNAVVLPAGWMLAETNMPATVSQTGEGRVRLDFVNPRPDQLDVTIIGRLRQ